ncbi:MAG: sulfite exporter TauE/SafE family protein [Bdellovibrionaceae bacterium]|nr:sulfite exporter TauE/SafE family protein [Pseudobdellovibrionaceae bacterium]
MEYIYLLLLGLCTGLVSSYFGIGGAAIIVPVLYSYFPQLTAATVIGSSLGVIILNSTFNSVLFLRSGVRFQIKIYAPLIPGLILGALTGTQLTQLISDLWLKRIFALILVFVTIKILFIKTPETKSDLHSPKTIVGLLIGFFVGIITGLTGLGGGTILVPTFLMIYKMPSKLVPAYNNLLMIVASATALMHFVLIPPPTNPSIFQAFQLGQSNWALIGIIFSGSLITSSWGVKLNKLTSDKNKKYIFGILLALLATQLILKTF